MLLLRFFLSLLLAAGLLLGGSAGGELVHSWADHTDTVHCRHGDKKEVSFESKHHHCSFSDLSLPVFAGSGPLVFSFRQVAPAPPLRPVAVPPHLWLTRCFSFVSGRGPPVA